MCKWGWLGADVSIFSVDESDWTFFMGGWGVGGNIFLVGGGGWTFSMGRWE